MICSCEDRADIILIMTTMVITSIKPQKHRFLCRILSSLEEPVEEGLPAEVVDGDISGILPEPDQWLAGKPADKIGLLVIREIQRPGRSEGREQQHQGDKQKHHDQQAQRPTEASVPLPPPPLLSLFRTLGHHCYLYTSPRHTRSRRPVNLRYTSAMLNNHHINATFNCDKFNWLLHSGKFEEMIPKMKELQIKLKAAHLS